MKITMNLKKGDLLTDSLDAFWGQGAKTTIPSPQVDNTPQDIFSPTENMNIAPQQQIASPQQSYNEYEEQGGSIKDMVENNVQSTTDMTPDPRAMNQFGQPMMVSQQIPQKQSNPFDLGGFDAMIQKQMSRERGGMFAVTPMGGFGGQRQLSEPEKIARDRVLFQAKAQKQNYADQRRYTNLAMMDYSRQSRAKQNISNQIIKNYKEAANKQRAQAGLPVYESPWDVLAGGKRVIKKKDAQGNETTELQRYGGLFGAIEDVVGYKGRKQKERSLEEKMEADAERQRQYQNEKQANELAKGQKELDLMGSSFDLKREELASIERREKIKADTAIGQAKFKWNEVKLRNQKSAPIVPSVEDIFSTPSKEESKFNTSATNFQYTDNVESAINEAWSDSEKKEKDLRDI